jgi:hypothetical protein
MNPGLDDLVGAIRAADGDDPELADATQLRVRRSLDSRARGRHQLVGVLTAIGILLIGTVSWALATGHVSALWTPSEPVIEPATAPPPPPAPKRRLAVVQVPPAPLIPDPPPPPAPASVEQPPAPAEHPLPVAPVNPPKRGRSSPVGSIAPVEALYRAAHDLHFHGGAPAATLAAWDAYLAAEPSGRFSVEARYNRALTLIRLGRYADARAALLPFALGSVEAGYRQREAGQLVERLAHLERSRRAALNAAPRSGDDRP